MYKILKQGSCRAFGKTIDKRALNKFYEIPAYCIYLEINNRKILIDTGYSNSFYESTKKFPERFMRYVTPVKKNILSLEETFRLNDLKLDENVNVLISHFHPDHIGSLKELSNNKVFASERELGLYKNLSSVKKVKNAFLEELLPKSFEFISLESTLKSEEFNEYFEEVYDIFGDKSIYAFSLFGHSPYQFGFYVPEYKFFYVADAIYSEKNLFLDEKLSKTLKMISWNKVEAEKTFQNIKRFVKDFKDIKIIVTHEVFEGE